MKPSLLKLLGSTPSKSGVTGKEKSPSGDFKTVIATTERLAPPSATPTEQSLPPPVITPAVSFVPRYSEQHTQTDDKLKSSLNKIPEDRKRAAEVKTHAPAEATHAQPVAVPLDVPVSLGTPAPKPVVTIERDAKSPELIKNAPVPAVEPPPSRGPASAHTAKSVSVRAGLSAERNAKGETLTATRPSTAPVISAFDRDVAKERKPERLEAAPAPQPLAQRREAVLGIRSVVVNDAADQPTSLSTPLAELGSPVGQATASFVGTTKPKVDAEQAPVAMPRITMAASPRVVTSVADPIKMDSASLPGLRENRERHAPQPVPSTTNASPRHIGLDRRPLVDVPKTPSGAPDVVIPRPTEFQVPSRRSIQQNAPAPSSEMPQPVPSATNVLPQHRSLDRRPRVNVSETPSGAPDVAVPRLTELRVTSHRSVQQNALAPSSEMPRTETVRELLTSVRSVGHAPPEQVPSARRATERPVDTAAVPFQRSQSSLSSAGSADTTGMTSLKTEGTATPPLPVFSSTPSTSPRRSEYVESKPPITVRPADGTLRTERNSLNSTRSAQVSPQMDAKPLAVAGRMEEAAIPPSNTGVRQKQVLTTPPESVRAPQLVPELPRLRPSQITAERKSAVPQDSPRVTTAATTAQSAPRPTTVETHLTTDLPAKPLAGNLVNEPVRAQTMPERIDDRPSRMVEPTIPASPMMQQPTNRLAATKQTAQVSQKTARPDTLPDKHGQQIHARERTVRPAQLGATRENNSAIPVSTGDARAPAVNASHTQSVSVEKQTATRIEQPVRQINGTTPRAEILRKDTSAPAKVLTDRVDTHTIADKPGARAGWAAPVIGKTHATSSPTEMGTTRREHTRTESPKPNEKSERPTHAAATVESIPATPPLAGKPTILQTEARALNDEGVNRRVDHQVVADVPQNLKVEESARHEGVPVEMPIHRPNRPVTDGRVPQPVTVESSANATLQRDAAHAPQSALPRREPVARQTTMPRPNETVTADPPNQNQTPRMNGFDARQSESPTPYKVEPQQITRDHAPETSVATLRGTAVEFPTMPISQPDGAGIVPRTVLTDSLKAALEKALEQSRKRLVEPDEVRLTLPFGEMGTLEIDVVRRADQFSIHIAAEPAAAAALEESRLAMAVWMREQGYAVERIDLSVRDGLSQQSQAGVDEQATHKGEHQRNARHSGVRTGLDTNVAEAVAQPRPTLSGARVWTA